MTVQGQPRKKVCETVSRKCPIQKRAGEGTQVVEHLLSKCEAQSSNPSKAKKEKKKKIY
jgi:hypothetical protein